MGPIDILKLIPHRHPFLLVDRIVEMESDSSGAGIKSGIGIKNVSANEHYLAGQADPVMPPLLVLEGIAQTAAALLCMYHLAVGEPPLIYFMGIDKARFRRLVRPGEVIHYHVEKTHSRGRVWRYRGRAIVEGALAAHAELSAVIAPAPESASS
jgi:3-hydroxyacyl-[acyl-carrier-protein] dehydratase